jgi:hypothetical protein
MFHHHFLNKMDQILEPGCARIRDVEKKERLALLPGK